MSLMEGVVDFGFSSEELEVCEILLRLPELIAQSLSSNGLLLSWGYKRKRSALNSSPSSSSITLPPLISGSATAATAAENNEGPALKKVEVKVLSPDTPLSFSLIQSDENVKRSSTKNVNGKRKLMLLENIEQLTETKQSLEGELENVKRYYDELYAINLELKAKKQELFLGLEKQDTTQTEDGNTSPPMETTQPQPPTLENHPPSPIPSIDQKAAITEPIQNVDDPVAQMSISCEHIDPIGIPDLNLTMEELSHQTYSRMVAALARQRRMLLYKAKNKLQNSNSCR